MSDLPPRRSTGGSPDEEIERRLVPGRECESCNVCCVALTIEEPTLRKPQGIRCRNAMPDNRCGIYPDRPPTCRTFYCGWRLLRWIAGPMRPDRSSVLVNLRHEIGADGAQSYSVSFTLLNRTALRAEGLAESVAAAIGAGIETFLVVPGPPGHTAAIAPINDLLGEAVRSRNKAAVLDLLRRARSKGQTAPTVPLVLSEP